MTSLELSEDEAIRLRSRHRCGRALLRRRGYTVVERDVSPEGRCLACGTVCAGVFSEGAGP